MTHVEVSGFSRWRFQQRTRCHQLLDPDRREVQPVLLFLLQLFRFSPPDPAKSSNTSLLTSSLFSPVAIRWNRVGKCKYYDFISILYA